MKVPKVEMTPARRVALERSKEHETQVLSYMQYLHEDPENRGLTDPRWMAIARTDFEKAFMSLNRAIMSGGRSE